MQRKLFALLLLSFACAVDAFAAGPQSNSFPLDDCRIEGRTSAVAARCGWYAVAEDRDTVNSPHIRIRVSVIPALRRQALPDPIFIISGGPGQAASDFYLSSQGAFERLRRNRDLVLIDQRGTGQSQRLDCQFPDDLETAQVAVDALQGATRECLKKLSGDPRFYTTSVAVRDLDEIRTALGYDKINLYGISYGTRVVQHYVRRFGANVRSIVLDGIVPIELALGPDVAPAAQKTLDTIFARCAQDSICNNTFGDVTQKFNALRARLASASLSMTVADPKTGEPLELNWGLSHLVVATRLLSYTDATASLLPLFVDQAAHNRPQAFAAQALLVSRDLNEQIANGMHNAVVCTEDVPYFDKVARSDKTIDQSYLGRVFVNALVSMCAVWPKGVIDPDFHAPLQSAVPALLLSGGNDPVTPAAYGERAAKAFSKGLHIVFPGQGHGQLNLPCASQLMAQFVESGSADKLNLECVAKQRAAPFMLNATGPAP